MSQGSGREAMLEVFCIITGLTKKEVEQKKPLRELLDRVDKIKVKTRCYHFGILSFYYPRRTKDGFYHPFLGISVNLGVVEMTKQGTVILPTYEPIPVDFDIELSFADKLAKRFIAKMAKQKVREEERRRKAEKKKAARAFKKMEGKNLLVAAATGASIEVAVV